MIFDEYAQYYDVIYKRKDYKKECAYLEKLFKNKVKTVLDLGCGTASHMVPFIEKGYKMTGIDASGRMLKLAAKKLDKLDLRAELVKGKLQSSQWFYQLERKFDAVLCLFSVIDYITQKKDLSLMLKNVARHMKKTSLFIFDFWNESAVNGYYSPFKTNSFGFDGKVLHRSSITTIDRSGIWRF